MSTVVSQRLAPSAAAFLGNSQRHVAVGRPLTTPRRKCHHPRLGLNARPVAIATASTGNGPPQVGGQALMTWLKQQGANNDKSSIAMVDIDGDPLDTTVAAVDLQPGDVALSIPEKLCVTLDRVFEDETVAEVLTTNKLSELACLTLYLMYEKKNGDSSYWYHFIKELDRERGRGQSGVQALLLWDEEEAADLLEGSPVLAQLAERKASIEQEYEELDTVWFMAGSLFQNYPYDIPTEAFSKELFITAFAVVQSCVVHLQNVPLSKRFAIVPMGPPLTTYKSTSKSTLAYNPETKAVELKVDRAFRKGEPLESWCGPQPNTRLLINYGLVDLENPYDKMQTTVTIPQSDPLYSKKRTILQQVELAAKSTFDLTLSQPLPSRLLPVLRLAHVDDSETLQGLTFDDLCKPISGANEASALALLQSHIQAKLNAYKTTIEEDTRIISSSDTTAKQKVASKLLKIEKGILQSTLREINAAADGIDLSAAKAVVGPKLS